MKELKTVLKEANNTRELQERKRQGYIKTFLRSHKIRQTSVANQIKAFLLGAEYTDIAENIDKYLHKSLAPNTEYLTFEDFVDWYFTPVPFKFNNGDVVKFKSLEEIQSYKDFESYFVSNWFYEEELEHLLNTIFVVAAKENKFAFNIYSLKDLNPTEKIRADFCNMYIPEDFLEKVN